jgi:predicted GIY-YIG superfamily endonuclease
MSTTNVYVLRLEGGHYYVGKSDNIMNRYQQHLNGYGSAWTRKHKPISIDKTYENVSSFEEDKITKEYMSKYGIDKVRGGSYVEIELSEFHIEALKMEIWAAKDLCTQCGRPGHFVKDCYAKTDASGNNIKYEETAGQKDRAVEWGCDYCDRTFTTQFGCGVHEKSCKGKNKKPSYLKNTSKKVDADEFGCEYCDRSFTTAFGRSVHEKSCGEKNSQTRYVKQNTTKLAGACYRCGNTGHYAPDCYATKHVKGHLID